MKAYSNGSSIQQEQEQERNTTPVTAHITLPAEVDFSRQDQLYPGVHLDIISHKQPALPEL